MTIVTYVPFPSRSNLLERRKKWEYIRPHYKTDVLAKYAS